MYINERGSEAPQIYKADIPISVRFKAKEGVFDLYDRATKKASKEKTLRIIPISDSRFTVKAAQVADGESVWSALYRHHKQHITVLKKKGTKTSIYAQGTWEEIKKDPNMKFTKVLFCLADIGGVWQPAQFELQGISAIMWQTISSKGTDRIMKLDVSSQKSFKTDKGFFYEMTGEPVDVISEDLDMKARDFSLEVQKVYDTNDANYEHYKKERGDKEEEQMGVDPAKAPVAPVAPAVVDDNIPTINLNEEVEEIKIEDVPF